MNGYRLKKLRQERNLKQSELANLLHIAPSTIGMYERNLREPDDETKFKIAKLFETTVAYLMGESNDRYKKHDNTFIAFYEENKDKLDEEDIDTLMNMFEAYIKSKKKK